MLVVKNLPAQNADHRDYTEMASDILVATVETQFRDGYAETADTAFH